MATIKSTIELVDKMSATLSAIEGNINSVKDTLKSVSDTQSDIDGFSWNTFISNAEAAGEKMVKIGSKMTAAVTAPLVLLGKKLYGNAVDYESAYVGMTKTVEGTVEQYEALNETVLQLSETTPSAYTELMGIAQSGGNLGVTIDNMETFLKSYSALQAATDQHIAGESGAQDVASFLNITDGGVQNIERFASTIVDLGNHFNATEDQIIAMGNRMAAAANLAGLSTPEILGMATAFRSVGINAEAGGSSAGKLIKQMQLASEVGGQAQERLSAAGYDFGSALDFSYTLDSMKKSDLADMAESLGMTTEAVKSMADSWLLMEQFSEVSGKTSQQFIEDWGNSPAQAMSDFFTGLSLLGDQGGETILATLDKMGLTEIRESNLIAAMASHPEIFASAVETAVQAYGANTALWEEFGKQTSTQAAQNEMLSNKLNNSMADLGDNLVQAVQPALDAVNGLLDSFNKLSETDQTNLINAFLVFAAGGPIVTAIGGTITAIGKISSGISKITTKISGFLGSGGLASLLSSPVTWGIAAGAGILLFIDYLDSIPTKFEELAKGATDIPITIDDAAYQETLSKIQEVQNALNDLKPGEIRTEYENASAAVAYGFGTQDMFASALGYETAKANANINQVASDYAEKMTDAQNRIAAAAGAGDTAAAEAAKQEYEGLRTALDGELAAMKAEYTTKISDLFSGMASQYPEAAQALTDAASNYDIMRLFAEASQVSFYNDDGTYNQAAEAQVEAYNKALAKAAWDSGFFEDQFGGFSNFESFYESFGSGVLGNTGLYMEDFRNQIMEKLNSELQILSDNPLLSTWLSDMLSNPATVENMDVTNLTGALEGIFKLLDYQNALKQAGDKPEEWGKYVSEGLGSGIEGSASLPVGAGQTMGSDTIEAIKAALGVASPSTFMIEAGLNVDEGLGLGIANNAAMATGAASAMAGQVVTVTISTLVPPAPAIGLNFSLGIAAGIRSGASAVISAAIAVANAGVNAAKGALGISSPSKETYWQGEMLIAGYVNALEDGANLVRKTVENTVRGTDMEWNNGVWAMISSFAQTEQQALQDEFNHVTDGVKINDSDIKKIRSLAEREVINKITTPTFNVNFSPTVHETEPGASAEEVIKTLEDYCVERLEACAEGVYT